MNYEELSTQWKELSHLQHANVTATFRTIWGVSNEAQDAYIKQMDEFLLNLRKCSYAERLTAFNETVAPTVERQRKYGLRQNKEFKYWEIYNINTSEIVLTVIGYGAACSETTRMNLEYA